MAQKNSIAVFSIIGRSKTGKTTLIEQLIPLLEKKGLRVATIKHHHHDFEIDREGKDTHRHKAAGAKTTVLASPVKIALVTDVERELTVHEIIQKYIHDVDMVIAEGYKGERLPKIEVFQWKEGIEPVCLGDGSLIALVTDKLIDAPVPQFLRDDIEGIVKFIMGFLSQGKEGEIKKRSR